MPSLGELLEAYAEGRRKQEFGPTYAEEARLRAAQAGSAEAELANAPLRTRALEQSLESGAQTLETLKRQAEDYSRRREALRRLGIPDFDVAGEGMEYLEQAPNRELARKSAQTDLDIAQRRLEGMPTGEEARKTREAEEAYRRGMAEYYRGGGRQAGARYTGRPLDEEVYTAARSEVLANLPEGTLPPDVRYDPRSGKFKKKATGWLGADWTAVDPTYSLTPEELAKIHVLTMERLRAAGFSDEAMLKAGLAPAASGSPSGDCDPEGLGLGCE